MEMVLSCGCWKIMALLQLSLSPKLVVKEAALDRQSFDVIWKDICPKKAKVFLWIFSFERLNTYCRIQRNLQNYALSPMICSLYEWVSFMHLFLCPVTTSSWGRLFSLFNLQQCWVLGLYFVLCRIFSYYLIRLKTHIHR